MTMTFSETNDAAAEQTLYAKSWHLKEKRPKQTNKQTTKAFQKYD